MHCDKRIGQGSREQIDERFCGDVMNVERWSYDDYDVVDDCN